MKLYIVIRDFQDGPDTDLSAVAWDADRALEKAIVANTKAPSWAKENPIIRVAAYELKEVGR